jgi:hypothetical protein
MLIQSSTATGVWVALVTPRCDSGHGIARFLASLLRFVQLDSERTSIERQQTAGFVTKE